MFKSKSKKCLNLNQKETMNIKRPTNIETKVIKFNYESFR